MKYRSYNSEIKIATNMLLDVFNDIKIDRRDKNNYAEKTIDVPCLYGQRSRILKSLENRNQTLPLPLVTLSLNGLYRDGGRVHSVNDHIGLAADKHFNIKDCIAVPITLVYTLSIATKFSEDMFQIMSNFIPFYNPDIYVTWPGPNNIGNIKSQIVFKGDFNIDLNEEIADDTATMLTADTTFEFKTWLFPGLDEEQVDGGPLIYVVNFHLLPPVSGNIMVGDLNAFYEVPKSMTFDDYLDQIKAGRILSPNFDIVTYPSMHDAKGVQAVKDLVCPDINSDICDALSGV